MTFSLSLFTLSNMTFSLSLDTSAAKSDARGFIREASWSESVFFQSE